MTALTTYALRLPKSVKAEAEALSKADGTSLNQFVATAVAEKIVVIRTAAFFEERAGRARAAAQRGEPSALLAALSRAGGDPPREGDELPEGWVPRSARALRQREASAKTVLYSSYVAAKDRRAVGAAPEHNRRSRTRHARQGFVAKQGPHDDD